MVSLGALAFRNVMMKALRAMATNAHKRKPNHLPQKPLNKLINDICVLEKESKKEKKKKQEKTNRNTHRTEDDTQ